MEETWEFAAVRGIAAENSDYFNNWDQSSLELEECLLNTNDSFMENNYRHQTLINPPLTTDTKLKLRHKIFTFQPPNEWSGRHVRLKYQMVVSAVIFSLSASLGVKKINFGFVEFNESLSVFFLLVGSLFFAVFSAISFLYQTYFESTRSLKVTPILERFLSINQIQLNSVSAQSEDILGFSGKYLRQTPVIFAPETIDHFTDGTHDSWKSFVLKKFDDHMRPIVEFLNVTCPTIQRDLNSEFSLLDLEAIENKHPICYRKLDLLKRSMDNYFTLIDDAKIKLSHLRKQDGTKVLSQMKAMHVEFMDIKRASKLALNSHETLNYEFRKHTETDQHFLVMLSVIVPTTIAFLMTLSGCFFIVCPKLISYIQ